MPALEHLPMEGLRRPDRALRWRTSTSDAGSSGSWIDLSEMDPDPANKESLLGATVHARSDHGRSGQDVPPDLAPQAAPLVLTALAQAASTLMPWRRLGWAAAATVVALSVGSAVLVRRWSQ